MAAKSPLAPARFPDLPAVDGVRLSAGACGIRYEGRTDVLLVELAPGSTIAGVFTRSKTAAAPVLWCQDAATGGKARAIVVNSGNANAFTGRVGETEVDRTVRTAAELVGCPRRQVFVSSTGVIGEPLPEGLLGGFLPGLHKALAAPGWRTAAEAIMTTDTFPKGAGAETEIAGQKVRIAGIAKGSGMIAPDMATMLAYVFTDARLPASVLQPLLRRANAGSFNAITVDSDTSTSDTVLLCATGAARHPRITEPGDRRLGGFKRALGAVMTDLAQQIVRDGEGAQKFITVRVTGATSSRAAHRIAKAIAESPLVKTGIAGEDANWGRIVMAVGKAGEAADRDRLAIRMGGVLVAERGAAAEGYDETPVANHLKGRDILIEVDLGLGRGKATMWTCDLTHGYIDINASYRS